MKWKWFYKHRPLEQSANLFVGNQALPPPGNNVWACTRLREIWDYSKLSQDRNLNQEKGVLLLVRIVTLKPTKNTWSKTLNSLDLKDAEFSMAHCSTTLEFLNNSAEKRQNKVIVLYKVLPGESPYFEVELNNVCTETK